MFAQLDKTASPEPVEIQPADAPALEMRQAIIAVAVTGMELLVANDEGLDAGLGKVIRGLSTYIDSSHNATGL